MAASRSPSELQSTVGAGWGTSRAEHEQSAHAIGSLVDASHRATSLAELKLLTALSSALADRLTSRSVADRKPGDLTGDLCRRVREVQADALRATRVVQRQVLRSARLTPDMLQLLKSWMESTVDARVMQQNLELQRLVGELASEISLQPGTGDVEVMADPVEPLTAAALGRSLGNLSDETVRARERAGQLFSILRLGRKRGREYPAFQAWPGIAGEPLAKVLATLHADSGTEAYGFFTSPNRELGGLTPIEVLIGRVTNARELERDATVLLKALDNERLDSVLAAAQAYAADLAA